MILLWLKAGEGSALKCRVSHKVKESVCQSRGGGGALRAEETLVPLRGGGWVVVLLSLTASLCFDSFAETDRAEE